MSNVGISYETACMHVSKFFSSHGLTHGALYDRCCDVLAAAVRKHGIAAATTPAMIERIVLEQVKHRSAAVEDGLRMGREPQARRAS